MDVYGGTNSTIKHGHNKDHSCYSFRDYMFTFQFYINVDKQIKPEDRRDWKEAIGFLHGMRDAVTANTDPAFKAYMCYIDPEDHLPDEPTKPIPASYYYGTQQYAKLKEFKEEFDPEHRLWNPQTVGAENLGRIQLTSS